MSEDGKTYTFHLRDDVKFHDGTPFDADAVKKNIDAVQQNKKLHSWLKISTLIDNVKVKDKYTVIEFERSIWTAVGLISDASSICICVSKRL